jgi:hypothetical protein
MIIYLCCTLSGPWSHPWAPWSALWMQGPRKARSADVRASRCLCQLYHCRRGRCQAGVRLGSVDALRFAQADRSLFPDTFPSKYFQVCTRLNLRSPVLFIACNLPVYFALPLTQIRLRSTNNVVSASKITSALTPCWYWLPWKPFCNIFLQVEAAVKKAVEEHGRISGVANCTGRLLSATRSELIVYMDSVRAFCSFVRGVCLC